MELYYTTHVFCCINEREPGHPRGCCKAKNSEAIREYLKQRVKELRLPQMRINTSGCLDRCELGPVIVVYPEGDWYHCPTVEDAEELLQERIIKGIPVERLRLHPKQKRLEQS